MRNMEEKKKLEILKRELEIENNILKQNYKQEKDENKKKIDRLEQERNELQSKLDSIIYSRSYKLIQKIKNILKRG